MNFIFKIRLGTDRSCTDLPVNRWEAAGMGEFDVSQGLEVGQIGRMTGIQQVGSKSVGVSQKSADRY